jgi:hypothetical protein
LNDAGKCHIFASEPLRPQQGVEQVRKQENRGDACNPEVHNDPQSFSQSFMKAQQIQKNATAMATNKRSSIGFCLSVYEKDGVT